MNDLQIQRAIQESGKRAVLTHGTFMLRPHSGKITIICGVAEQALLGESTLDQFWICRVVLFPLVKYVDRHGRFVGEVVGNVLTSHVSLDEDLERTWEASERARAPVMDLGERFLLDGGAMGFVDGQERLGKGLFLIRPAACEEDRTIVCGYDSESDILAGTPEADRDKDQVWTARLLLCPVKRYEDRDGVYQGHQPGQILCSGFDPNQFHLLTD